MSLQFECDPEKATRNERIHHVTFEEASTVFGDTLATPVPAPDHSDVEDGWLTTEGRRDYELGV